LGRVHGGGVNSGFIQAGASTFGVDDFEAFASSARVYALAVGSMAATDAGASRSTSDDFRFPNNSVGVSF